jgi:DNA-binding transcriptional regulator YiaG
MKTRTESNYPYAAAGRVWIIPTYTLAVLPDGTPVVLKTELDRVHRAIGNEICGSPENLIVEELDFLCDITATTYTELADMLDMNRSSLSRWKRPGAVPSRATSNLLKRWFWMKLFGGDLGDVEVPLTLLNRDAKLLEYLHQRALDDGVAGPVERRVA